MPGFKLPLPILSRDILDFVICLHTATIYDSSISILDSTKMNISGMSEDIVKQKIPFSFRKTFQVRLTKFLLHRHFKTQGGLLTHRVTPRILKVIISVSYGFYL